jgi:hypothetical protein
VEKWSLTENSDPLQAAVYWGSHNRSLSAIGNYTRLDDYVVRDSIGSSVEVAANAQMEVKHFTFRTDTNESCVQALLDLNFREQKQVGNQQLE